MDQAFQNAIRAQKARVFCFGLRLQPLTVGHLFALYEIGSALPDHCEEATDADVITAVLVCSQKSHEKALQMLESPWARLGFKIWGWIFRRRNDEGEQAQIFGEYLRDNLSTPEPDAYGRGGELRIPLCWRLLALLMADFHMSKDEALKTPVALAVTLWSVDADRRGTSKLASERVLSFRAFAAEQDRIWAAQQQAN